jgi:hypothetical protein
MARCQLCGGTGSAHTLICPKSPKRGMPVEYWVDWHLTKHGWFHGDRVDADVFYKSDRDQSEVLLSIRVGATEVDGQVKGEVWQGDEVRGKGSDEETRVARAAHPFPGRYMV